MKKSLLVVLSMLFVVGITASAFADVTFGGDARVRGIWKSNYDLNSDVDKDDRYYDYRIRLKADVKADNVQIKSRISLTDWNEVWAGAPSRTNVLFDYGYLVVPVIENFTLTAGKVVDDWGNRFWRWDERAYRLSLGTKAGDTNVEIYTEKLGDTRNTLTGNDNLKDFDRYALRVTQKLGDLNGGLTFVYDNDARPTVDKSGQILDVFLGGNVGGLGVAAELAYMFGKLNEDTAGNNRVGFFVQVLKNINALTVSGALAYAANGYTADNNFTPTVFFGTDQPTAIANFQAASDSTTLAVVGSATYKVSDALSVTGRAAYANLENLGAELGGADSGDETAIEIDAGLRYQIAKNTTYNLDFGYLIPSDITTNDDAALALAHKIEVKF